MILTFTVFGTPQPQGSARAFMHKGAKFPTVTSDNPKNRPWRQEIALTAIAQMKHEKLALVDNKTPLRVEASFYFDPPQSAKRKIHKTTRPDGDKLLRSLLDALTGIVYADDSQVSQFEVYKFFGAPSRVEIKISDELSRTL
jgi:crossover junction endodeoxyribonuclease RusA